MRVVLGLVSLLVVLAIAGLSARKGLDATRGAAVPALQVPAGAEAAAGAGAVPGNVPMQSQQIQQQYQKALEQALQTPRAEPAD